MGEVNTYFKEKYETEQVDYEKKLRRHKLSVMYRSLLAVAIVIALIVAIYYNYQKSVYTGYETIKKLDYTEADSAEYLNFNGNVLRYSKDGASAFNLDNDMIWNETFEMQNPRIDICDDYVALGDYKGTRILVFNSEGLQGTIDTTIPLRTFCVAGNGNVAAVLEEDDITWVKLYDKNGTNIANDRTTMAKSGYPVNVDISKDGIILGVSYLYADSGQLSSSVAFYNFGAVGQNEIDNLVSGYNYSDTVVSFMEFINQKTCFAVGDDRLVIFSGDQKPQNTFELLLQDEVQGVYYNEDHIGLVFNNESGEDRTRLEVYDTQGNQELTLNFTLEYTDIIFNKDMVILYNSTECEMYNMKGLQKFKGTFEDSALTLIPTGSRTRYLLVSGKKMEEIRLK